MDKTDILKKSQRTIPLEELAGILKGPLTSKKLIAEGRKNESKFDD